MKQNNELRDGNLSEPDWLFMLKIFARYKQLLKNQLNPIVTYDLSLLTL